MVLVMKMPLSFLLELANALSLSIAELGKGFGRSRQNIHELITTGKNIPLESVEDIRMKAHEAGWSDTVLLDKICRDARELKKKKVKK